jgi:hypothetical protein
LHPVCLHAHWKGLKHFYFGVLAKGEGIESDLHPAFRAAGQNSAHYCASFSHRFEILLRG